jgi:hypothetical protein
MKHSLEFWEFMEYFDGVIEQKSLQNQRFAGFWNVLVAKCPNRFYTDDCKWDGYLILSGKILQLLSLCLVQPAGTMEELLLIKSLYVA